MSSSNNHPLPTAPSASQPRYYQQQQPAQQQQYQQPSSQAQSQKYQQQQQQQQQQNRPRAKSTFSFRSNHSRKSSQGSAHKLELNESHDEKNRLHTKADPTLAMQEAEPSAVASGVKTSLASIRDIQHRDATGNVIADPDRSNPTRSRWERPLDTIRSFEAAVDGNYRRSSMRPESVSDASQYNRRSSYYGGTQVTADERPRGPGSYYGAGQRSSMYRPESQYQANNYADNNGGNNGYHPNRARYPRTASEPQFNAGGYPPAGNPHSYETVTTASGSGGDPAGYTTDPSSENSSVERYGGIPGRDQQESYGSNGHSPQYTLQGAPVNGQNGYQMQGRPGVPQKDSVPRAPIKLGAGGANEPTVYEAPQPTADKRKSWFGRRMSKNK